MKQLGIPVDASILGMKDDGRHSAPCWALLPRGTHSFGSFWLFLSLCQIAREPPRPTQSRVAPSDARGKRLALNKSLIKGNPFEALCVG
jgi:hypothetical protein